MQRQGQQEYRMQLLINLLDTKMKKYIFFTKDGKGNETSKKYADEGSTVLIADDKVKILKKMKAMKDKSDWCIVFDEGLEKYEEVANKLGFEVQEQAKEGTIDPDAFETLKANLMEALDKSKKDLMVKNTHVEDMENLKKGHEEEKEKMKLDHQKEINALKQEIEDILAS